MSRGTVSGRTILQWACMALALLFFALPIAFLVSVSFKTPDDVLTGHLLPTRPTLDNWWKTFELVPVSRFLVNSLVVSSASSLLTVAIALPATYAMVRHKVGGSFLPGFTLATYVAPPVVALVPLFLLLRFLGLLNSLTGLSLVYGLSNLPVAFWLLAGFIRPLPREIEQAAQLDGAGHFTIVTRIIAPLVAPGLAATALICGILAYDEFLLASAFTNDAASRTLPVGVSLFQGERLVNFGQMAVASLTGILPVYLIGVFAQRWLVGGLVAGGVK